MANEKKMKEDLQIGLLKGEIRTVKTELDRYVKTLARSAFIETCTSGAYFNELHNKTLDDGLNAIQDSKKSEKEKGKLRNELLWGEEGLGVQNYEGSLKRNLKYHEHLVGWAKGALQNLDNKTKEKIINDSFEQKELWASQMVHLYEVLEKLKGKSKKK